MPLGRSREIRKAYNYHELIVYADDNILSGFINTITKYSSFSSRWHGLSLEINAEKTKYMLMSRDHHGGKNQNISTDGRLKILEQSERIKILFV